MVHLMQKYIFSKIKSSHNAQNAQKWPPKYPKRPKTVQNPKWPKNFKPACAFLHKEPHIRCVVHCFSDFCSQNPHFWAKNPKKCIFEEIAKISVHNQGEFTPLLAEKVAYSLKSVGRPSKKTTEMQQLPDQSQAEIFGLLLGGHSIQNRTRISSRNEKYLT